MLNGWWHAKGEHRPAKGGADPRAVEAMPKSPRPNQDLDGRGHVHTLPLPPRPLTEDILPKSLVDMVSGLADERSSHKSFEELADQMQAAITRERASVLGPRSREATAHAHW